MDVFWFGKIRTFLRKKEAQWVGGAVRLAVKNGTFPCFFKSKFKSKW